MSYTEYDKTIYASYIKCATTFKTNNIVLLNLYIVFIEVPI